jgi:sRNA-binding carbon storage regulator CsrA
MVIKVDKRHVRIGIEAPRDMTVLRRELVAAGIFAVPAEPTPVIRKSR